MNLKAYFDAFPRGKRGQERRRFAELHQVSEVTVRSWANGVRRHPCNLDSVRKTEDFTAFQVTRYELRPDIFGSPDIISDMGRSHHSEARQFQAEHA